MRPSGEQTLMALIGGVTGASWHSDIKRWVADVPELRERTVQGLDELLTELSEEQVTALGVDLIHY